VPVTARLSKLFYDRLGEEIANELVNWFNQVDATYRSDLKEVNELNFARFDAKLEQRLAQFESKFEQRLAQSEAKVEQRLAQFESKIEQRLARFEVEIAHRFSEQTRWMFLCWATLLASNIALWMRH
jgi:DNA anti-recombination protein RmuC